MVDVAIFDYGAGNIFSLKTSLEKNGATVDVITSFDQTKNYSGLLLPGVGNFDPAIRSIRDYSATDFKEYVGTNLPVLGICLGSQLIAKTFGASVYHGPKKEIGFFHDLILDNNNMSDLFTGYNNPFTAFHWHEETFTLPQNAIRLVSSNNYPNQAFKIGTAVL